MARKARVHLTGGEGIGWALDTDLRLAREALEPMVEITDLAECDVVHAVHWDQLTRYPRSALAGKRLVCQVPEPERYAGNPRFRHVQDLVACWVALNADAARHLSAVGRRNVHVPQIADMATFPPREADSASRQAMRQRLNLPGDRYLIGSFQRDSEGRDLSVPKLAKGPDVFAEVMRALVSAGAPIHVVLAGPRRHWLRARLDAWSIPYTYFGQVTAADDVRSNILPVETIRDLYAALDLYLVSSRSEGGPRGILEGLLSGCKVMSTRVGLAAEVLEAGSLYDTPMEAADRIREDLATDVLAAQMAGPRARVLANYGLESATEHLRGLYDSWDALAPYEPDERSGRSSTRRPSRVGRLVRRLLPRSATQSEVTLWHEFHEPPYGGGNQFMLALRNELVKSGTTVQTNRASEQSRGHLVNAHYYHFPALLKDAARGARNVVHRVDGPVYLVRGSSKERDDEVFAFNQRYARTTVIQSLWSYERTVEAGYEPVRPVVIVNGVDANIFHARGRIEQSPNRKLKIIASSWSNNPRKGTPVYKWLEEHLDWDRYEFTFVGRSPEAFTRIRHVEAVPSEQLAALLRQHDIYITASKQDPCSNALIEALACGLPALYVNDGGHPEIVGKGGLPFEDVEEIPSQLDRLAANLESFQRLIAVPTMAEVAKKYLALLLDEA